MRMSAGMLFFVFTILFTTKDTKIARGLDNTAPRPSSSKKAVLAAADSSPSACRQRDPQRARWGRAFSGTDASVAKTVAKAFQESSGSPRKLFIKPTYDEERRMRNGKVFTITYL